jgi:hypothetical protein
MRTLLISALATTLVGCSYPLRPQTGTESCAHVNGFACFDRAAASQPIEPKPVSFKTNSGPLEIKPAMAAKTKKPSSARVRDKAYLATKTKKPTTIAAKTEPPASPVPLPPRSPETRLQPATSAASDSDTIRANTTGSRANDVAVANSTTTTIQEQVAAATEVAERMTIASLVTAPEPNNYDRSDHSETVPRGDAEKTAPAQPNKTALLIYLLMARSEIKSVSDLSGKIIAIDDRFSASNGDVRTAIVAAGASEVLLFVSRTKAIDRLIGGEVPAAVLALVSQEAAAGFPDILGYKIFRIPLSPRSSKAHL